MKKAKQPDAEPCPCGSGLSYDACCGRFIADGDAPVTALDLMRSRYTAHVLGDESYLRATWDPSTCPADLAPGHPRPRWLGLDVRRHAPVDDTHAIVEFVARYKVGGRAYRLHETSRFTRGHDGRWRYVDGDVADEAAQHEPGP